MVARPQAVPIQDSVAHKVPNGIQHPSIEATAGEDPIAHEVGGDLGSRLTQAWREPALCKASGGGAPSDSWLQELLSAERAGLVGYLEWRHERLLTELRGEAQQHAAENSSPLVAPVRGAPAAPARVSSVPLPAERSSSPIGPRPPLPPLPSSIEESETDAVDDHQGGGLKIVAMDRHRSWQPPPQPTPGAAGLADESSLQRCGVDSGVKTSPGRNRRAWERPEFESGREPHASEDDVESPRSPQSPKRSLRSLDDGLCSPKSIAEVKRQMSFGPVDQEGHDFLRRLAKHPRFELAVSSLIMANALIMSVQIQWQGLDMGHSLEYRRYDSSAEATWPGAGDAFDVIDFAFGVIYVVELVIKIAGLRLSWFFNAWNHLDFVICALWLIENTVKNLLKLPTQSTILRVARLFRLLRIVKVLRTLNGFDSLYLLMTTLKGSLWVLGWSCVLLFVVQMMIAMALWIFLKVMYFDDTSYPVEERREVFEYFGTFARIMLTMFEMTLANWPPVCRLLVEYISEWFMVFFILHKLTIGFAVIGVINGVFMQETFKVASTDDRIMMRQRQREVKVHTKKMERLFKAADSSGDGLIELEEFKQIVSDPEINMWLSSMDLPVRDPENLYSLLDVDGDGELTCEELVKGAMKLRGAAKSFDMLALRRDLEAIIRKLLEHPAVSKEPSQSTNGSGAPEKVEN